MRPPYPAEIDLYRLFDEHGLLADPRRTPVPALVGVTNDSRAVAPGFAFVAIPGANCDGHDYIEQAIGRGAVLIVHTRSLTLSGVCAIRVSDAYFAYALLCEYFYGFPARRLRLHCVTGTNGKTTSAFLLRRIFESAGHPCGLISTIKYAFGTREREAARTTPAAGELQSLFREMVDGGCSDAVMEASSHGLSQHRFGGVRFQTALFTNLTQDHLDYHLTMENYYQAKKLLFTDYQPTHKIINCDDPYGKRLAEEVGGAVMFGQSENADFRISDIELRADGSVFRLNGQSFHTGLPGEHNIYNLTGVLVAAALNGLDMAGAAVAVDGVHVDGRLEHIDIRGIHCYVDYAHTPDALEQVLSLLKKIAPRRIITVFGCGGNRDRAKRPLMGQAVARKSDLVIVTSDNPRNENPEAIIDDILKGCPSAIVEPDRRRAIIRALELARPDDVVLIAGKGHENYQEINGEKHDFSDMVELRRLSTPVA